MTGLVISFVRARYNIYFVFTLCRFLWPFWTLGALLFEVPPPLSSFFVLGKDRTCTARKVNPFAPFVLLYVLPPPPIISPPVHAARARRWAAIQQLPPSPRDSPSQLTRSAGRES